MMTLFLWAGETLIVSSWTEKSSRGACGGGKLYTYIRSGDDLNICEFRCSPDVVLFHVITVDWYESEAHDERFYGNGCYCLETLQRKEILPTLSAAMLENLCAKK